MDGSQETDDDEQVHPRAIIHIDMDYYYAQVEEVLNPTLKDKPFAVKQRFCVVTSNYIARQYGVKKLQPVKEALAVCPGLVLINGEDITKYKEMSVRINEIMHRFTPHVEKLGLDENYLDVTELVSERIELLEASGDRTKLDHVEGLIHPAPQSDASIEAATDRDLFRRCCCCGCDKRLILATHLAKEIRDSIFSELGLKCCAGIAHNKLLAKLVGAVNKQNKQTVLLPTYGSTFVASLGCVKSLTGIGEKTAQTLADCCGISTVTDLQQVNLDKLAKHLGQEQAVRLKQLAFGRDETPVRQTGKPKSVGLEDSCPSISVRADAEEKFRHLLVRLVKNIADDGRIPVAIKVTVRKFDMAKRTTHRESKQDKLLPSMFRHANGRLVLTDGAQEKMLAVVMKVFERMVDLRQPFNITLLGLSFFKFQERRLGSKSIANFLIKKSDIEVQSITNLSNESITLSDVSLCSNKSSLSAMDCEPCCSSDAGSIASLSGSESDAEPSPKKSRRMIFLARRSLGAAEHRHLGNNEDETTLSKLRVADLRLNSKEYDQDSPTSTPCCSTAATPMDVTGALHSASKGSFFRNHLASTSTDSGVPRDTDRLVATSASAVKPNSEAISDTNNRDSHADQPQHNTVHNKSTNLLPPNVDPEVFDALPEDVQQELLSNWRRAIGSSSTSTSGTVGILSSGSLGAVNVVPTASATSGGTGNTSNSSSNTSPSATTTGKGNTKNTLHRYFVKNT
ncbi:DNA polymerase iota [Anopheles ziemanni]|uniref:DNA polymerase iota n=1 Tax=Anopheles ziemanni TaxID=345580 RepID=UPI0026598C33|nr:DNA polymerase iota isoform X1 [Anopheles coustani]XP_058174419.1 DNA polymerase iota [Anopheles ziemanni]